MQPEALLPLPAATFHILLALADEDRHGYAIIQDVAERTGGAVRLSAGTLYRSIQRMLEQGLIVETRERPAPELDDERRRYYRLTAFGRAVARAEAGRMSNLLEQARVSGLAPKRDVTVRFYGALLRLFPAAFRNEYEAEMAALFAQRRRSANWPLGVVGLWAETLADIAANALLAHWDILRQDLAYGLRQLARSQGYALTVVLVSALGVGANTAVFSVTDHVLIRPLPYPGSQRLVALWEDQTARGYRQNEPLAGNYRDWKAMSRSFEALAAWRGLSLNLQSEGGPERLEGAAVTAEAFPMLGARPLLGRVFDAADDAPEAPGTLVLSHSLWVNRFGSDRGVIGRKLLLDDSAWTVIGVMPPEFNFRLRTVSMWAPMRFGPEDFQDRENNYLHVVGKLQPGVSLEQARAEMHVVAGRLARQYPKENGYIGIRVNRLRDELSQRARDILITLMAGSLCVLLIACTNLANLMLARALGRRRELAVRSALGAGRERLVRQLLTESVLLAVAGGAVGVLLAVAITPLLGHLVPGSLPIAETPAVDLRVLGFALLTAIATGLAFGIVPALRT